MSRRLQPLAVELWLDPATYRLRDGDVVGTMPASDLDALAWDVRATGFRGTDAHGAGWAGSGRGEVYATRAALRASSGRYTTDEGYDVGSNGPRTCRTPTLRAAGVRAWLAVELLFDEPDDTAVRFRVYDGTDEYFWDGAAWTLASDPADDWSTAADVAAHLPAFPARERALAFTAWLSTSSRTATPAFYGARLAYGVRWVSSLDDALVRTVLASLRGALAVTGVSEWTTPDEVSELALPGASAQPEADEWPYRPTGVEAVFDLTADPDEAEELAGTYDEGTRTWTADDPVPAGHVLRIEFTYTPDVVVRRHRDALELRRLPAVYLAPSGAFQDVRWGQAPALVRDLAASPPAALSVPVPSLADVPLEVRVVAELGSDVERIAHALRAWIGPAGYRVLASPESGQVISVRELQPPVETTGTLSQGICEARASWSLALPLATTATTTSPTLLSAAGLTIDTEE